MPRLITLRRVSQVFFFLLFTYLLWSATYPLKGLVSPKILFELDPLLMALTALSERLLLAGLLWSLGLLLLTLVLGRFFCGWVCPLGAVIDWTGAVRPRRRPLADGLSRALSQPKYYLLGLLTLLALFGLQVAWLLDPIATLARVVSLNIIPAVTLALDRLFRFLVQDLGLYGGVYDFYRFLKQGLLGVNAHFFSNSLFTLGWFLLLALASLWVPRLWCRLLCPLGALYALAAKPAWLERWVDGCTQCGACQASCPMGAIAPDGSYRKAECTLCLRCVDACPTGVTAFTFKRGTPQAKAEEQGRGLTRAQFLLLFGALLPWLTGRRASAQSLEAGQGHPVIRPPGAMPEERFVNACVRCGNCMKVCVTNGLQPVMLESGWLGLWSPQLVPEVGCCEYNCTLCGQVCPTGAIPNLPVAEKQRVKLGLAEINHQICLAWDGNEACIVCEEHCPVPSKAIKTTEERVNGRTIFRPVVDEALCIGCGICQNVCPVRPVRAIRVNPRRV